MAEYGLVVKVDARQATTEAGKLRGEMNKLNKTFLDSQGKLRDVNGRFVKMSKGAGTARASFKALGATFSTYLAPLVAFGAAVKGVTDSMAVFSQRQKDTEALANGLKGMTTDGAAALASLKQSADELGKATLFDEEDFTRSFKLLTSFKTIGVSSYDEVAQTAADMATVLDQDVSSVMLQVAKALEAPDVGLTALQRSGTRFTDSQKEMVKSMVETGDVAGAQAFILKELERQYGGAAEAAATGFAGAMDTLGEVTRDAMEGLGEFLSPAITKGVEFLQVTVEKISEFFNLLSRTVLPAAQKAMKPIVESFEKAFAKIDFEAIFNLFSNVFVGSLELIANAFGLISPLIAGFIDSLVWVLEHSPFGMMVTNLMKLADFLGLTKSQTDELATAADDANKSFEDIPAAVDEAAKAQERKLQLLKDTVDLVEDETSNLKKQEAAFENALKVTDARLNAEIAINKLELQGLEIAYEMAKTAEKRLDIANQIFEAELEGAALAYQQTLNSIEAEQKKLEFAKEAAEIEARLIEAEGDLNAEMANSLEKKQAILDKTQDLVDAQLEQVNLIDRQITAQAEIAEHQKTAAAAQLASAVQTAEQNRIQKLVSDEIGHSEEAANKTTEAYSRSLQESLGIRDAIAEVTGNTVEAQQGFMHIEVHANNAATAIRNAAAAQRELNAAQSGSTGGTTTTVVGQAAGGYNLGAFKAFAQGGVVTGPTLGLIGEGGEPEYIIPESKAAGFAANYLSGQRGASAVPGFAEGGYVGPVNITTGPVMQQGGTNYVTMEQFEAGIRDMASAVTRSSRSYGTRRFSGVS